MRQVLSLSLSSLDISQMKSTAKKRGYESISSYIKDLLKADVNLISETELLKTVKEARKEYKEGKSIKAKSIADLL